MIDRLLFRHPRELGESYGEHQRAALSFAWPLLGAGVACLVHAVVPACFESTASRTIRALNQRMLANRRPSRPERLSG